EHVVADDGRVSMSVRSPWGVTRVEVPVPGMHMASNSLAAIAIAGVCGVDVEVAAAGIASTSLSPMRMESVVTARGARILSDCYNANPASMRAALETLASMPASRRVAVLGLMAELADSPREHSAIAELARSLRVEIVAVGTDAYGVAPVGVDEAADTLNALGADAVGLVKGSRVAALERVVSALRRP
ncbi:MAG: glutamate ligase domain-containing protein, partial [Actinomycetota bacterium]